MTGPLYDEGEAALVDALMHEFGWESFRKTLHTHPEARPFQADGLSRLRLGNVEFWLDGGVVCFGVERAGALHTGAVQGGVFQWDEPLPLAPPGLN